MSNTLNIENEIKKIAEASTAMMIANLSFQIRQYESKTNKLEKENAQLKAKVEKLKECIKLVVDTRTHHSKCDHFFGDCSCIDRNHFNIENYLEKAVLVLKQLEGEK